MYEPSAFLAAIPERSLQDDRALVDAPCSGLGVLNRRPDLRWRATPLPDLQLELLRAAAERVWPGGTIVYSVCTIDAEESESVVDASELEVDMSLGDEWPRFRWPGGQKGYMDAEILAMLGRHEEAEDALRQALSLSGRRDFDDDELRITPPGNLAAPAPKRGRNRAAGAPS